MFLDHFYSCAPAPDGWSISEGDCGELVFHEEIQVRTNISICRSIMIIIPN